MCGRYVLARAGLDYVVPLMTDTGRAEPEPPSHHPSWNVAPGKGQLIIFPNGTTARAHWGYRPKWAADKGLKPMINATVEKADGSAWKWLWKSGRVVVPADGWFEWIVGKDRKKHPYFIRLKSREPIYMAGLCSTKPGAEPRDGDGFVVVTTAAEGELAVIHDRRPVVFTAADARTWLDAQSTPEMARMLALNACVPPDAFEWFPVSQMVNRSDTDGAHLIDPLDGLDFGGAGPFN